MQQIAAQRSPARVPVEQFRDHDRRLLSIRRIDRHVVVGAEIGQPVDQDRRAERQKDEPAKRRGACRVSPAKPGASARREERQFQREHSHDANGREGVPAAKQKHPEQAKRERERDAARETADARVVPGGQGEEPRQPIGQTQHGDHQNQATDVGHAARDDRQPRGIGGEGGQRR